MKRRFISNTVCKCDFGLSIVMPAWASRHISKGETSRNARYKKSRKMEVMEHIVRNKVTVPVQ